MSWGEWKTRERERERLNSIGWVDRTKRTIGINKRTFWAKYSSIELNQIK